MVSSRIPVGSFHAIVDDADYEWLNQSRWTPAVRGNNIYARQTSTDGGEYMHKMITGFDQTDHRNAIGLDNRRENLRVASNAKNNMNKFKQAVIKGNPPTSKFKGVTWDRGRGLWAAKATKDRKTYNLGRFADEREAAKAYDAKALQLFGEYARTNF